MKKKLSVLLLAGMMVCAACGGSSGEAKDPTPTASVVDDAAVTPVPEATTAPETPEA